MDYNNALLDAIVNAFNMDLQDIMSWRPMRKNWPTSPEHVQAWDVPTPFLKCDMVSTETEAIGTRALYFNTQTLIVYPQTLVGDHYDKKVEDVIRLDSAVLEQYFYHFDYHNPFKQELNLTFNELTDVREVIEITHQIGSVPTTADVRPAVVLSATFVVEQSIYNFDFDTFFGRVRMLKGK